MKITDFFNVEAISADIQATDKKGVLKELVELLVKAGEVKEKDKDKIIKILLEREALGSTGIGQGIGIPHGKFGGVKKLVGAFGLSRKGVDFESLDGEAVFIFFLLVAPEDSAGPHLKALARISRLLKDKYFRETLKAAKDEKTLIKIIKQEDQKK
ncbi:MAG: PTS sugar transporter subunit IIA [Candidatus Omnitrophica bacterium]|nr:PTS sugar transporter subunit IIA [Candidatus Omnitrophota bacterium]